MINELHSIKIKTKRGKDFIPPPDSTEISLTPGVIPGSIATKIKLPGQGQFVSCGDLMIRNGAIEIPIPFVFLAHAKEDSLVVKNLCDRLTKEGILTWFDDVDLLVGDDLELQINKGLRKADFVVVFLSNKSCKKEGYFQKELKIALAKHEQMPEGDRYIIPFLIDECEPPMSLSKLYWLKMERDDWYQVLLKSIRS